MKIIAIGEIDRTTWNDVVLSSPDGWVFSLYEWQELILPVERWGLQERSFGVERDGRIVAVVPLQYSNTWKVTASSGWGGSGPVLVPGLSRDEENAVLCEVIKQICASARHDHAERISMSISPITKRSLTNRTGVSPTYKFGFAETSTDAMVVDLSQTEDQLWLGLSQIARRKIRKAKSEGYSAELLDWVKNIDPYYDIHCETYFRTGVEPHPKAYFEGMALKISPLGFNFLLGGKAPNGSVVAFHNSAKMPHSAVYHTGCSRTAHQNSGVNYLLFWEAMLQAKRLGCEWYEVGEIFSGSTDKKSRGLTEIKTKFGGVPRRYFKGHTERLEPFFLFDEKYDSQTFEEYAFIDDDQFR
ncbi:GNAT family N-acetyltransferase [Bradyrhizobium sp. AUGA SZCCT0182]|uniref:lipid II:glycine glycyltransferase FemX n=1 Tax=Bradyrhizobium sp. AUGA SZCCT0182 TaxID=2807667 RepID=UPI001BACEABF|nr:GNAT family N-acetyltransferase [Bradyrhizobium sp. AUGA SZCCT0182]MBR1236040.1 peptidoglycan bridge formation glycyltransferase FemA/FemB family protein [Bradyrhizobium sp. AUGA SZCCT0182]